MTGKVLRVGGIKETLGARTGTRPAADCCWQSGSHVTPQPSQKHIASWATPAQNRLSIAGDVCSCCSLGRHKFARSFVRLRKTLAARRENVDRLVFPMSNQVPCAESTYCSMILCFLRVVSECICLSLFSDQADYLELKPYLRAGRMSLSLYESRFHHANIRWQAHLQCSVCQG